MEEYLDFSRLVTDPSVGMIDLLQRIKDSNVTLKVLFSDRGLSLKTRLLSRPNLWLLDCACTDPVASTG